MKSILKYCPSVLIPIVCSAIMIIIYGNVINPDIYGDYSIFTTIISLVNIVAFSFLTSSVVRFFVKYKKDYMGEIYLNTIVNTMIAIIMFFTIILFIFYKIKTVLIVTSLMSVVVFALIGNIFRAIDNSFIYNITNIVSSLFTVITLLLYLHLGKLSTESLIIIAYFPQLIVSLFVGVFYKIRKKIKFKLECDLGILKESIRYGGPLVVSGLLSIILSSSDRFIIKIFFNSSEVGIYSFGYRMAEIIIVNITMVLILSLYPKVIALYDNKKIELVQKTISTYVDINFAIIIPIIILLSIYINSILENMFIKYIDSGPVIILNLIAMIFYSVSFYTNKAFELSKNTNKMMFALIVSAILNLVFNFILIPYYGCTGAIIATMISYGIYILISKHISKKIINIKLNYKNILIILSINIIVVILFFIIKLNFKNILYDDFFVKIICGSSAYIGAYLFLLYIFVKKKILSINIKLLK